MERDILISQISALSRNADKKIKILQYIKDNPGSQGSKIFKNVHLGITERTVDDYLTQLRDGNLIYSPKDRDREFYLIHRGITNLIFSHKPRVMNALRTTDCLWDDSINITTIKETLDYNDDEAIKFSKEIAEFVEDLPFHYVSTATLCFLITELLYQKDRKADALKYTPIGMTLKHAIKNLKTPNPDRIHMRNIETYFKAQFAYRRIPYKMFELIKKHRCVYIHGLHNVDSPINILHEPRLLFFEGLNVGLHKVKPAMTINSALTQLLCLIGYTSYDEISTQGIPHLNYYLAPFIDKNIQKQKSNLKNLCEGFIWELFRAYATRPINYINSSITIDLDADSFVEQRIVKSGKFKEHTAYNEYGSQAHDLAVGLIGALSDGLDEGHIINYPKIFLALNGETPDCLFGDSELMEYLYNILKRGPGNSFYILNRQTDVNYLSDLSKINTLKDSWRARGVYFSSTIVGPIGSCEKMDIDKFNTSILNIIEQIHAAVLFKKSEIEKAFPSKEDKESRFQIIGAGWKKLGIQSYYNLEDSYAQIGMLDLKSMLQHYDKEIKKGNHKAILSLATDLILDMKKRMLEYEEDTGIKYRLGQTPAGSGAVNWFTTRYNLKDKPYTLLPKIYAPIESNCETMNPKTLLGYENQLQSLFDGGYVTRLFYNSSEYTIENMKNDLELCFNNGIELINFRNIKED